MTQDRAILFIDARNVLGGSLEHRKQVPNFELNYQRVMEFFATEYKVIRGYYYDGAPHPSKRTTERRQYFEYLRKLGITLKLKEIDFDKHRPSQKGVDINLTADMISLAYEEAYDIAILLSGDGDYVSLVDLVKSKGKRVIVLSFKSCLAVTLKECADKVLYFENIPELSTRKP